MTTPTYAALSDPSQGGIGFTPESWDARLLTILAILASGQNPDGTPYPGGGGGGGGVISNTSANWTSTNPTLPVGAIGYETDTGQFKIGTGLLPWTQLPYVINTITTLVPDHGLTDNSPELQSFLNTTATQGPGVVLIPPATSYYGFGSTVQMPAGILVRGGGYYGARNPGPDVPVAGSVYGTMFGPAFNWNGLNPGGLFRLGVNSGVEWVSFTGTAPDVAVPNCNAANSTTVTTTSSILGVSLGATVRMGTGPVNQLPGVYVQTITPGAPNQITFNAPLTLTNQTLTFALETSWCIDQEGTATSTGGMRMHKCTFGGSGAHCINDRGLNWSQDSDFSECSLTNTWPSRQLKAGTTYIQTATYSATGFPASGIFPGSSGPTFKCAGNFGPLSGFLIPVGAAVIDFTTGNGTSKTGNTVYTTSNPVWDASPNFTYFTVGLQSGVSISFTTGSLIIPYNMGWRVCSSDVKAVDIKLQYAGLIVQGDDVVFTAAHLTEPIATVGPTNVAVTAGQGTATLTLSQGSSGYAMGTAQLVPGAPVFDSNSVLPVGTYIQSINQLSSQITLNTSTTTGVGTLTFATVPNLIYDAGKASTFASITMDSASGNLAYIWRLRGSFGVVGNLLLQAQTSGAQRPVVLDAGLDASTASLQGTSLIGQTFSVQSGSIGLGGLFRYMNGGNPFDMIIGERMPAGELPDVTLASIATGATFIGISRGCSLGGVLLAENPSTAGISGGDVVVSGGVAEVVGIESVPWVGTPPSLNGAAVTTDRQTNPGTWTTGQIALPSLANVVVGQLVTSNLSGAFSPGTAVTFIHNTTGTISVSPPPVLPSTNITSTPASWGGQVGQFPNADAANMVVGALITGAGITAPAVISAIGNPGGSTTPVTITAAIVGTTTGVVNAGSLTSSAYVIASSLVTTTGLWRSSSGTLTAQRVISNFSGVQVQGFQQIGLNNNGPPTWQVSNVTVSTTPATVNGVSCAGTLTLPAASPFSSASLSGNQPVNDSTLLQPTPGNAWLQAGTVIPSGPNGAAVSGTTVGLSLVPSNSGSDTVQFSSTGFFLPGDRCYDPNTFTFWTTQTGQQSSGLAPVDFSSDRTHSITITNPTLTSGTATQIDLIADSTVYLDITLGGTLSVAIGPTSGVSHVLYTSVAVTTATAFPPILVPGGYFIKVTATTAIYTATAVIQ